VTAAGPLAMGKYTAVAEQLLETPASVSFHVDRSSPSVTLDMPKSLWGDRTPSFTGTASEHDGRRPHL
jgi:hypothetical protein